MSTKLKVTPRVTRLINYIEDIENGRLKVPSFQRNFVWGKKEKLDLFESLKKGYPIGSVLFWKPDEVFSTKDIIGPYKMKPTKPNFEYFYILDGFQRLTTLFGCLVSPQKTSLDVLDNIVSDFSIYYDLENEEFTLSRGTPKEVSYLPVNILIDTFALLNYSDELRRAYDDNKKADLLINRARVLASTLLDYELPAIQIIGGAIEDAVDIFSRINSMGMKISTDWMLSALTYNDNKFTLGEEIDTLIEDLAIYNFDEIKRDLILQCIQTSYGKLFFDVKLNDIIKDKPVFVNKARSSIKSIKRAVQFLFEDLLVIDSKLLPYGSQLIFLSYFFQEVENPTKLQLNNLKKWFWVTTYSNYFTIYSLSKQRAAFNHFKDFVKLDNQSPVYNDKPTIKFQVADFPRKIALGSVRANALVLFLLNYSNNFHPIRSEQVDHYKIFYLFPHVQTPENAIVTINYISEFNERNLIQDKLLNIKSLLSRSDFNTFSANYFLDEKLKKFILSNYSISDNILSYRLSIIIKAEKAFINQFEEILYEEQFF
ncbi:DUF262 domain-containing protein [Sediminibacterium sp.]|uniref:DUF262 domain-containing protein n=1 Tax=Sediminibacterium sp. TaxID=1917865 RepID=UPI003F72A92E